MAEVWQKSDQALSARFAGFPKGMPKTEENILTKKVFSYNTFWVI